MVKGFAQKKRIDFDEIFSPVVKMNSIRTILSLVAVEDLHLEQLDVNIAFLHDIWRKRYTCSNQKDMRPSSVVYDLAKNKSELVYL